MLNLAKGNMYSFVSHTWNTVKGECHHGCSYCHPDGTMILMGDLSLKPIELVQVSDEIIGLVKDASKGFYKFAKSVVVANSVREAETIGFRTEDGYLECTPEHPLMGSTPDRNCGDWKAARAFSPYENLRYLHTQNRKDYSRSKIIGFSLKGSKHSKIISMVATGKKKVYNLQTACENFIANGFIVHNCYMKRWGEQKPVHFDKKELKTDLGDGNFIFVGSSCDMWADAIPQAWIIETLNHCRKFGNKYLFQSKNPKRIWTLKDFLPPNSVVGTTIETNRDNIINSISNAPSISDRLYWIKKIAEYKI